MNRSNTKVLSVFADALACESAEARAELLDRACGGDEALRSEIEALLDAHEESGNFLKGRESPINLVAADEPANDDAIGTVVGPYKLLEQIGEGGMGVVYMAEQQSPVRRHVALKIIKPGMDSRKVIARFEAERQALALMEHPHIARVLDAGMIDRRPYFVMELVKGIPITQYCDNRRLELRARLELFIPVCEAVQHAHQKGVIHRDLKPSNVLVADYDERPVAKIIDFGVAKAIGQKLTEKTMFTGFGQVVGTIEYMSPEQAKLNQLDIDTRTDVYSLGVLLYELITGSTPFGGQRTGNAAFDEMLRIVREEPPPKPSTRLSTSATLPAIAANRGMDPARLGKTVRGELDWIAMKCLEKDRNRRYEAASALAQDLRRYLRHDPVAAGPPSAAYRLRKFARRNRAILLTVGMCAAALVAGTIVSVSQAVRASRAEALAESRFEAERRAHQNTDKALARADVNARQARRAIDDMYTQVAERWLAQQPQMEPVQREFLEKALRFYSELANESGGEPSVRLETARAFRRIANIQHRLGQTNLAEGAYEQATNRLQTLDEEFPNAREYRTNLAAALHEFGVLLGDTGRYADEEKLHRQALALEERLAADFPEESGYRRDLGRGHWFVARVLTSQRRRPEAVQAYRSALEIQTPLVAEFPTVPAYREDLAETQFGLGQVLRLLGQTEEHRQALGEAAKLYESLCDEFPSIPGYRNQLANVHYWLMRGFPPSQEAERHLRRALALQEKLAADYPAVADYRFDLFRSQRELGWVLSRTNRPQEAETALRQSTAIADKLIADCPTVHYYRGGSALSYAALGKFLAENGRYPDAEDAYRQTVALLERLVDEFPDVPAYWPDLRETYFHYASVLNRAGHSEAAADAYAKALRVDPHDTEGLGQVAWLLVTNPDSHFHDPAKAIELAQQALQLAPQKTSHWRALGAAHYRAGHWQESLAALAKAKGSRSQTDKLVCCFVAMAHWQLGHQDEARKSYEEAAKLDEASSEFDQLRRFLAEAAELMGINETQSPTPTSD